MKRCKTCKWWGDDADDAKGSSRYRNTQLCTSPKINQATETKVVTEIADTPDWREVVDQVVDATENPVAPDEAGLLDGSGYFAAIRTGPEFGCVHHEPKAEPATREEALAELAREAQERGEYD